MASPASDSGRQLCRVGTVKARTVVITHPVAITTITGHGSKSEAGNCGGCGSSVIADQRTRMPTLSPALSTICRVKDPNARLASDLALAVMRFTRQLRVRRSESAVSLTQLSALSTLAKEGSMTPGELAVREQVRPPSMTRVIASLAEQGLVARTAHPVDGRQVMVSALPAGVSLIEAERRATQDWLKDRLARLDPDERETLVAAADLISAMVDDGA